VVTPTRLYVAVAINHKGQKGVVSGRQSVPLVTPPSAPSGEQVEYSETAITVSWTSPLDFRQPIFAAPGPDVLKSRTFGMTTPSGAFNVYEVLPPPRPGAVKMPEAPPPGGRMPVPVNDKPLAGPPFVDKRVQLGSERCYAVRTVTQIGTLSLESDPSVPACVSLVDHFPPAPPKGLQAVSGEGAISLIWEANTESDLDGYLVLRSEAGGPFKPLTPAPIAETTFRDSTATRGVRYSYVVVAVDKAKNQSQPSNQVEEVAR
jgi:hypothetical protein